ncbi:hypothetical protein V8E36_002274 [Tilletia maclaganii]
MKVALAFLALVALLTFATASPSPFDVVHDEGALLRRAGTKYVGASCTSSAECYSANCVNATTSKPGTCQRQVTGGVCSKTENCATYNCNSGKCITPSKANGVCSNSTQCSSGLQCSGGICGSLIAPNQRCDETSQCQAGQCLNYYCRDSAGNPIDCPSSSTDESGYPLHDSYCGRYALGHSCVNQGDCELGLCKNGKCSANGEGATCRYDFECSDLNALCTNGKCLTPAKGSAYPRDRCSAADQCRTGSCPTFLIGKDSEGVNNGVASSLSRKRYTSDGQGGLCAYYKEGQTGCRDLFDCDTQLCKNSTCVFGSGGDRCSINYQCKSKVCGLDGKCIDPPSDPKYSRGHPCASNSQCLSKRCNPTDSFRVKRPSLFQANVTVQEYDFTCLQSMLGGACRVTLDCDKLQCVNSVCSKALSTTTTTSKATASSA